MLKTCTLIFLRDAYFSTLGTICCRFWLRERSQRSMESLVKRYIASCCFLHSKYYLSFHAVYRPFSCLSSSVPVLKHDMSKDEESKASEVLLCPVLTGSVRKHPIVPTHRDLWYPSSHLDICAQHPSICWPLVAECTLDYSSFLQKLRVHFGLGVIIIGNYSYKYHCFQS